jgi:hypothetical protein
MNRFITLALTVAGIAAATPALAQGAATGPGKVVITVIPAGATFFTEAEENPDSGSFGSYDLGGAVALNFNRYVGVEAEVSGSIGVSQLIERGSSTFDGRSPNALNFSANLVLSAPNKTSIVPYVAGGAGGLTMFERSGLIDGDAQTLFTGNVGAGMSWYAGRWGLRGDYRFIAVQSKDDAPPFFGREERFGHRIYVGVLLNVAR